jgi:hypothetical protein
METYETFTVDTEQPAPEEAKSTDIACAPAKADMQQMTLFKAIDDPLQLEWLIEFVRTGKVYDTCDQVGISHWRYLNWKTQAVFCKAFEAAISIRKGITQDLTFEKFYEGALHGFEVPVFNKNGKQIGTRRKPDTRLLLRAMETQHPDHRAVTRRSVEGKVDHKHAHLHAHMQQIESLPADEIDRLAEEGAITLYQTQD